MASQQIRTISEERAEQLANIPGVLVKSPEGGLGISRELRASLLNSLSQQLSDHTAEAADVAEPDES